MLWKCYTQYVSKFGKLNSGHRTGKGQFSFQSQRKAMPKNVQTTAQLHLSHMLAAFLNHRSNCQHPLDHRKNKSSRKTSTSSLLTNSKPLTVWITTNCEKFFKRWEYQTTWSASWEICMQVKKQQLEQWTASKIGTTWNNRLVPNWERSTSRLYIVTLLI